MKQKLGYCLLHNLITYLKIYLVLSDKQRGKDSVVPLIRLHTCVPSNCLYACSFLEHT